MKIDAMAFGAHPDDIELTCAGTLIKLASNGYQTAVIAVTGGELGTRGTPEMRAAEFSRAAAVMGAGVHRCLDIADGNVQATWANKLKVIEVIREFQPHIVFAPYWVDRHPDHVNTSALVSEAAFLSGLKKVDTGQPPHRPQRVVFYPCRFDFTPSFIVDVTQEHDRKLEAIRAYQSQFYDPARSQSGEAETNISHPGFLETIVARARQYGSYIGTEFGEAFLVREPLKLDDPVAFFRPDSQFKFL